MNKKIKVIVSGGGTGGHIFPAISIANEIKAMYPEAEILFVGAEGRMEMQRVPDAGYQIIGLPVAGFNRKQLWKNFSVLIKLLKSQWKARKIIKEFKPQVAVGVGGYASGPTLKAAAMAGIPTLIQEQNSFAGITNKLLAKSAQKICVAYDGMERFFPKEKIILTGNPVRQNLLSCNKTHEEAKQSFGLDPHKKTILILGGSLGARTLNQVLLKHLKDIQENTDIQFIWQTGKLYIDGIKKSIQEFTREEVKDGHCPAIKNLFVNDFIKDMAIAYKSADLVISRAGAGSISEFCLLGKPVILVPSPNVSEDHQTHNAMALVNKKVALFVSDAEAPEKLYDLAIRTVKDDRQLHELQNISQLGLPDAASDIANEVLRLIKQQEQ